MQGNLNRLGYLVAASNFAIKCSGFGAESETAKGSGFGKSWLVSGMADQELGVGAVSETARGIEKLLAGLWYLVWVHRSRLCT